MEEVLKVLSKHATLVSQRSTFVTQWDDCVFFCLPEESVVTSKDSSEGAERSKPVDSTGIGAAQDLASGLFSNTVAMGQEWFTLRPKHEDLGNDEEISSWLAEATRRVLKGMQNSNFALTVQECFTKYAVLGTGVFYSEMTPRGLVFAEYSIADCCIDEDAEGRVNTCFREYWYTPLQAAEKWGEDALSESMKEALNDSAKAATRTKFLHAVFPRTHRDPEAIDGRNKPWASYHIEIGQKHVVDEGGYDSFPYAVPRFYKIGRERYGRSPAMQALPDLRMVNRATSDLINGVEMAMLPPLFLPGEFQDPKTIDLRPGAVNPVAMGPDGRMPEAYQTNFRFDYGMDFILKKQEAIKGFFFADLFRAMEDQKNMTATEVDARIDEKIQSITPVVSRLQTELYAPVVERIVLLMASEGLLPEVPQKLLDSGGLDFVVSYTTRLDAKLAQVETSNIGKAIGQVAQIMEAMQAIQDLGNIFDLDKIVRFVAKANNVPPDLLRSSAEVEKMRKQAAQAAQAMKQQQAAQASMKPVDPTRAVEPGSPIDMLEKGGAR